jgi:hypothetical protein
MTTAPLPLPIDLTVSAANLAPSPDDLMLAAGGVVLSNPTDAAAAYPYLWSTWKAAKSAFERTGQMGTKEGRLALFPNRDVVTSEIIMSYRDQPSPTGYRHQEYPKWVLGVLVGSREEEDKILASAAAAADGDRTVLLPGVGVLLVVRADHGTGGAARMRLLRKRKRQGFRPIQVDVNERVIAWLICESHLDGANRDNHQHIGAILSQIIEALVPISN